MAKRPTGTELDEALAILLANTGSGATRRIRRHRSILEIAEAIDVARLRLGSLREVSERVGLSTEMLSDFLSATKLSSAVRDLVKSRALDSVDIVRKLSRLPRVDQLPVADLVVKEGLNSEDVRAIVSLRKLRPTESIAQIIEHVRRSRPIREYEVQFPLPRSSRERDAIRGRVEETLGRENVKSLSFTTEMGILLLTERGEAALREYARSNGFTKKEAAEKILRGGAT